jgi:prophage antirepressor-like protein
MTNAHKSKPGPTNGNELGKNGAETSKNNDLVTVGPTKFNFEGATVRMIWINGLPWFLAADVCRALKIDVEKGVGPKLKNLDDDEKREVDREQFLSDHPANFEGWEFEGNSPSVWLISESGLYLLALRSQSAVKKATAAYRFRGFVTREVLPAIRATGSYGAKALPSDAPSAKLTEPGREEMTFDLTKAARYVITVFPNEPTHIRETPLDAMLDEWSAFDTDILASHIRTVHALWQKTQLMRSIGGDPAGSPLYDRLGATIIEGRRLADEYLRHVAIRPD